MIERNPEKMTPGGQEPREPDPDQAFIYSFGDMLWAEVQQRFAELGRGAVVIDTATAIRTEDEKDKDGNDFFLRYGYIDQRNVEEMGKPDLIHKVRTYDPANEYIAVFIRQGQTTSYRVGVFPDNKPSRPKG